jgi:glycosyltransferase involved in cell wall biosynthesis
MKSLEAVMIVKNEEACLGRALESICGIDRITILDTGSTDRTGEIARAHGANFIEGAYVWEDHFANARNKALEYAVSDWILIIDADEVLEAGSLERIRAAIEEVDDSILALKFIVVSAGGGNEHIVVRCHRRHPDVFWKGAAHNYLTAQDGPLINAKIIYGHSPAHDLDPDRTLRILEREVAARPEKPREVYYLAREYYTRQKWDDAISTYLKYVEISNWAPEKADAFLMLARCRIAVGDFEQAWFDVCQSLRVNADLREGLLMLAALSGPVNRAKWTEYSALATNSLALFVRNDLALEEVIEKGPEYYQEAFAQFPDMSRYEELNIAAAKLCGSGKVLDMGCGLGQMRQYVRDPDLYHGFDFAGVAEGDCFEVGDIYEYPLEGYDVYLLLEVLEHVDDIEVLSRIPCGSRVVFSVPSFPDPAHIRTYTDESMRSRLGELVEIKTVIRFNWSGGKWREGGEKTDQHILLAEGRKK